MKKQTAVEWLANEMPVINWSDPYWKVKLEKAKAMEKEQIEEAYQADRTPCSEEDAEQYYNESYKGGDK
jgi:aldehyde:ferredoxin oxidoreductase